LDGLTAAGLPYFFPDLGGYGLTSHNQNDEILTFVSKYGTGHGIAVA
jgi:hypothetical protein